MPIIKEYDIQEKVNGFTFFDYIGKEDRDSKGSEYILYVKFIDYPHLINKCGLVMVDKRSNYVVNNDYRFHHLEIVEKDEYYEYNIISLNEKNPNKITSITYFKVK